MKNCIAEIRIILRMMRAELQNLFYTPIAWLVVVIFTIQTGTVFAESISANIRSQDLKYPLGFLTMDIFSGWRGLFQNVLKYIYLYIPLLTMGLMSREYYNGSVKLLYSSPVNSVRIIIGKYLAMMVTGLFMMAILGIYILFAVSTIKSPEIPLILSGMLGVYLLICVYAAIGLFMSCITSYQMVAAIGTLAILALLNFVSTLAQGVDFLREITYWLSLNGRSENFISGVILSKDLFYFILVIMLFVWWSVIKLKTDRKKTGLFFSLFQYVAVVLLVVIAGYITSRPKIVSFYDVTRTKSNSLVEASQQIMQQIQGGLSITTYTNLLDVNYNVALPASRNKDKERFASYIYARPDIEMKYVYYYDKTSNESLSRRYPGLSDEEKAKELAKVNQLNIDLFLSPDEIRKEIDLTVEGNRFVRVIENKESGKKTFLRLFDDATRHPSEAETSIALKRMVAELPKVGVLAGHGERMSSHDGDMHYNRFARDKGFRFSLVNQGFDVEDITLTQPVPEHITILIIADLQSELTNIERQHLNTYIGKGGNLMILGEPEKGYEYLNPLVQQFGISYTKEPILHGNTDFKPDFVRAVPVAGATKLSYHFDLLINNNRCVSMPGAAELTYEETRGYKVEPFLMAYSDHLKHEKITALTATRSLPDKEQKIAVIGDADCISNAEISMRRKGVKASNFAFVTGLFHWLSDGAAPLDTRRPSSDDTEIYLTAEKWSNWKIVLRMIFPAFIALAGATILIVRKRR
jgi:ABC-2 type transport system permease protein